MWSNSDGDQLKNIFAKLNRMSLSKDAKELMNISLLTNAYQPQKNITEEEFIKIKSEWLIKNSDLNLIEEYLTKNQIFDTHPKLPELASLTNPICVLYVALSEYASIRG